MVAVRKPNGIAVRREEEGAAVGRRKQESGGASPEPRGDVIEVKAG